MVERGKSKTNKTIKEIAIHLLFIKNLIFNLPYVHTFNLLYNLQTISKDCNIYADFFKPNYEKLAPASQ
jgi:hypothetical protein